MYLARRRFIASLAVAAFCSSAVSGSLMAQDRLDALRASGAVGESYDGFAVDRDGKNGALVDGINAKRRAIYDKQAKAEGVTLEAVGQVYAQQIMKKAPKGTWFLNQQKQWVQK
jgi:uncharacterized protein YdbL (DUF1318 family)